MEWSRSWGSRRRQGKRRDFGVAGSSADGVELEELGASGAGRANNDEDAGEARAARGAAAAGRRPPVRGWVPSALGQRRGWIDGFGSLGGGWLVRRGSRGGFGGVAVRDGMDGTNLLGFRVRLD